jgi:hypothetical protein
VSGVVAYLELDRGRAAEGLLPASPVCTKALAGTPGRQQPTQVSDALDVVINLENQSVEQHPCRRRTVVSGSKAVALTYLATPAGSNTGQGGSSGPWAIAGIVVAAVVILAIVALQRRR